jgi:outer membrane protein assembly factor BamB
MNSSIRLVDKFRIVLFIVTLSPLWLMLAAAGTLADAQATSSPADWTQFHRDNMQRWNPYETMLGVNNVGGLHLKWKNPIGTYGGGIESSPAVVNGVIYVGNEDGNIYALSVSTGVKLWSYATGYSVDSSPAVANGVVYFGDGVGNVYVLNAGNGAKLWSSTSFIVGEAVLSSPAVANGVVYVASSTNTGGILYALNATTGAKLWSYFIGKLNSSPAVVDGVVYMRSGSGLGNTYAFELGSADLFLRIFPSSTTVHQGDLLTFAFPVWNLGPDVAEGEVLSNLQVPAGTTFDYLRISGTPGLGTCTHPPYGGTGQIICHEGDGIAPNTTWTVRLTVKVTALAGTVITANAAAMSDTPDPDMANNTATVSLTVQ